MQLRTFLPVVVALFAALSMPSQALAQSTNVKTPNKNQSARFKSVIVKGSGNLIESNSYASFIGGGQLNTVFNGFTNAVIGGGFGNIVFNHFGAVAGGLSNTVSGELAAVLGGRQNTNSGYLSTAGGGLQNSISGFYAFMGGGEQNSASGNHATVAGGRYNTNSGDDSTIAGGFSNTVSNVRASIGGGCENAAGGWGSVVAGGENNTASSAYAVVGGGKGNEARYYSAVPGGSDNAATHNYGFAAGRRAKTTAAGQFVWADSQDADYTPAWANPANTFNVRAAGGVAFQKAQGGAGGEVYWKPGDADWTVVSDASAKENLRAVDAREILKHVASLPITEWSYKGYSERNIGPMAQDWHSAFPSLSDSDKAINSGDVQGVSLAAIQGLVEELKERDKIFEELRAKSAEVDELKTKLQSFEKRLNALPPAARQ